MLVAWARPSLLEDSLAPVPRSGIFPSSQSLDIASLVDSSKAAWLPRRPSRPTVNSEFKSSSKP